MPEPIAQQTALNHSAVAHFRVAFWQTMLSPHMTHLAAELAALGNETTFLAAEELSAARRELGWKSQNLPGVSFDSRVPVGAVAEKLAAFAPETVHLTQGLRGPPFVTASVKALRRTRARWGAMLERLDTRRVPAWAKRCGYRAIVARGRAPDLVLAIGEGTDAWCEQVGLAATTVFPFAYFLGTSRIDDPLERSQGLLRVGFIGQLIRRKRVDLLIEALHRLGRRNDVELIIIGDGPEKERLQQHASRLLGAGRFSFQATVSMATVRREIAMLDVLALPSDHDGWGAVVSEALIEGVPAVCSDACGSAIAVRASRVGGVFRAGSVDALSGALGSTLESNEWSRESRVRIKTWARCLTASAGARYLVEILDHRYHGQPRPRPPWEQRDTGVQTTASTFDHNDRVD